MEESKTVKEVLEDVLKILNGVKIPMSEIDNIGIPVARSINAINACIVAIEEDKKAQKPEEPVIELVEEAPQE